MYKINSNVVLVFGAKRSLIYDLRSDYLSIIWLNENETNELKNFIENKKKTFFIRNLINKEILDVEKIKKINFTLKEKIDFSLFNFAWIEVTNKCNFNCVHCYGSFSPKNFYELDINDIELIIKNLNQIGINNIQIIGGEPFLISRNKLKYIIDILRENHFNIEIFTNGYFIDKDWIDTFKKNKVKIAMSVYSHIGEIHNKITNNNSSFKHLKKSIQLLEENNISYRLAYVKTKYNNLSSINDIKNYFNSTAKIKSDPIRLVGKSTRTLLDDSLINERILALNYFKNLRIPSYFVKRNFFRHNCFSYKIYIDSSLNVFPCVMERRKKYGNIRNESLKELIIRNRDIVNLTKDTIEECKDCEFRYCCFDCRPDNNSRNFYKKPWYCTYNPLKGEWNETIK